MPAVLRQSGPKFKREGADVTPRALVAFCEGCNYEGAMFGDTVDGKRRFWCGFQDGKPQCKGKGKPK